MSGVIRTSNVLTPNVAGAERPAPYARVSLFSRALAALFAFLIGLAALWVIGAFLICFFFSNQALIGADGVTLSFPRPPTPVAGKILFSSQPFITRIAGFVDVVVAMTPVALVCWHLRRLFQRYARGIVFARENARHLQHVGVWLMIWPLAKFLANMLFQLAGGTDKAWSQMILIDSFILGLIVLTIARVMEFGHEIEQEKDSFI